MFGKQQDELSCCLFLVLGYGCTNRVVPLLIWRKKMTRKNHDRLVEIRGEMLELLREAGGIIRCDGGSGAWNRAQAYWYGAIQMDLTTEHDYVGSAGCSFEDTIKSLDVEEECERCGCSLDSTDIVICNDCGDSYCNDCLDPEKNTNGCQHS